MPILLPSDLSGDALAEFLIATRPAVLIADADYIDKHRTQIDSCAPLKQLVLSTLEESAGKAPGHQATLGDIESLGSETLIEPQKTRKSLAAASTHVFLSGMRRDIRHCTDHFQRPWKAGGPDT